MPGLEEGQHLSVLEQVTRRVRSHAVPVPACGRGRPSYGFRGKSAMRVSTPKMGEAECSERPRRHGGGQVGVEVFLLRSLQKVDELTLIRGSI